jgi:hypothetical protein
MRPIFLFRPFRDSARSALQKKSYRRFGQHREKTGFFVFSAEPVGRSGFPRKVNLRLGFRNF